MTVAAMDRLLECEFTVQYALDVDTDVLARIIYPVGFWRVSEGDEFGKQNNIFLQRKAHYIKATCQILREQYNDDIPKSIEDLCALPGQ